MEVKKNEKVNIEKTKAGFFQLGLVIVLSLSLIAFEWTSGQKGTNEFDTDSWHNLETDIIPATVWPEEEADAKPEVPEITEVFEIIDDGIKAENPFKAISDLFKENEEIPIEIYVPEEVPDPDEDAPYVRVEEMPTFMGGDQNNFARWVQSNVRYPLIPAENGVQGKVFVEFIVEPDGSVSNVLVVRNIDPELDAEAVRVVGASPEWTPGKQMGIAVRVRFTIVVNFQLQ